jgi:hypothetical protein
MGRLRARNDGRPVSSPFNPLAGVREWKGLRTVTPAIKRNWRSIWLVSGDFSEKGTTPESGGGDRTLKGRSGLTPQTLSLSSAPHHPDACADGERVPTAVRVLIPADSFLAIPFPTRHTDPRIHEMPIPRHCWSERPVVVQMGRQPVSRTY